MPTDPLVMLQITQIFASSIYAASVWDWLANLHREYHAIHRAPWSPLKVLYLMSRYWSLGAMGFSIYAYCATDISTKTCRTMVHWVPAVCIPITLTTEVILGLRCWAIWSHKQFILYGLVLLCSIETALMVWACVSVQSALPDGVPGPCLPASKPGARNINTMFFLSPFVVDFIITTLTMYKAFSLSREGSASGLIRTFIKDGLIYFVVVSAVNLLSAGLYLQDDPNLQGLTPAATLIISSVMCCHMFLSLREEGQSRVHVVESHMLKSAKLGGASTTNSPTTISSQHFPRSGTFRVPAPSKNSLAPGYQSTANGYGTGSVPGIEIEVGTDTVVDYEANEVAYTPQKARRHAKKSTSDSSTDTYVMDEKLAVRPADARR